MEVTRNNYFRMSKNDPNEARLLEYLKGLPNNSEHVVTMDDLGDDAMIQIRNEEYTPTLDDVLFNEYTI
jgi:hypothetical protein